MDSATVERFWSKVGRGADDECWPWQGTIERHGYARFWPTSETGIMVHRFAYELANGPIPEGLVIDHLCRVPHCVNPKHLEAVTNGENVLRGEGPTAVNARKTHCKRGHEFNDENTLLSKGKRWCKTCKREADIIRHAREREERLEAELRDTKDTLEAVKHSNRSLEAEVEKLREALLRVNADGNLLAGELKKAEAEVEKLRLAYEALNDEATQRMADAKKAEAERAEYVQIHRDQVLEDSATIGDLRRKVTGLEAERGRWEAHPRYILHTDGRIEPLPPASYTDSDVERVAEAMYETDEPISKAWEELHDHTANDYRVLARAALEAFLKGPE